MLSRIDHATIVTCDGGRVVVLEDASIAWEADTLRFVGPTSAALSSAGSMPQSGGGAAFSAVSEQMRGRPLGRILIAAGWVTPEQFLAALDRQKERHGVIGQTLIDLGYITEAQVEWALAVQAGRTPEPKSDEAARVIDGRRCLIVPGLINTHHHLFQSLTRGMKSVQSVPLFNWLTGLYPRWQQVDHEAVHRAAAISIAELLLGGCTTTVDHMYLYPPGRGVTLEAVIEAADMLGIRIHACRGSMSLGQSAGGLPPDACVEDEASIVADCARVVDEFHDSSPMSMRRIDLAPCAPFNVSPSLLDEMRSMAREHGLLLHTHIAETLDEEQYCRDHFGIRPVEYLQRHEWLGPDVYLAHCVYLNDDEIRLLADTGTGVAHCPCSNMRLGSGIAPVRRMIDAGVKVGIAVDGSSSNDGGHLLAEARQAMLLQRVHGGAAAMMPAEAFQLATVGGAAVLNRPELGRLAPGCAADFVVFDADDVAFAGAIAQDPLAALLLCCPPRPRQVVINGRTVVEQGVPTGVDLPKLVADFNQLVRERFSERG